MSAVEPRPASAGAANGTGMPRWPALALLADAALLFLFLYNISFLAAPPVSTGRVVLLALLLSHPRAIWRDLRWFARTHGAFVIAFALVVAHVAAVTLLDSASDYNQLSRLLNFAVMVLLGTFAFLAHVGNDPGRLARGVAMATGVQSLLIFVSYVSADFRQWVGTLLVEGGNIPLTSTIQVAGFSNSSGAALSVIQGLGVFAALHAARRERGGVRSVAFGLIACACALSTLAVGRTGLLMALAIFAAFAAANIGQRGLPRLAAALVIVAGAWSVWGDETIAFLDRVNPSLALTLDRSVSVLTSTTTDDSVVDLVTRPIPPLSTETIVGTGRVVAADGTNVSGHDSGYIQTYFAAGAVATVIFYAAWIALTLTHALRARHAGLMCTLLVLMLVIEFKEPFIFKYAVSFVLLSFSLAERAAPRRGLADAPA